MNRSHQGLAAANPLYRVMRQKVLRQSVVRRLVGSTALAALYLSCFNLLTARTA